TQHLARLVGGDAAAHPQDDPRPVHPLLHPRLSLPLLTVADGFPRVPRHRRPGARRPRRSRFPSILSVPADAPGGTEAPTLPRGFRAAGTHGDSALAARVPPSHTRGPAAALPGPSPGG